MTKILVLALLSCTISAMAISGEKVVEVYEGEKLVIDLNHFFPNNYFEGKLTVYKDGIVLLPNNNVTIIYDGGQITLIIKDIYPEDYGKYVFKLETRNGSQSYGIKVIVKDRN